MPRGRIIHPNAWTDSKFVRLSPFARLLFIGSWNYAYCDRGHLDDDPEGLAMKVLPKDPVEPVELLAELMAQGMVVRETVGDRSHLTIRNFGKWQAKDDSRWSPRCPICRNHEQPRKTTDVVSVERSGEESKGVEVRGARPSRYCPKHPQGTTQGCLGCKAAREAQELWDANKPSHTKRIRRDDPHNHEPDENGYCPTCGEK